MAKNMMKTIEVDEELYRYIAANTRHIGESASEILRRLLNIEAATNTNEAQKTAGSAPAKSQAVTKSPTASAQAPTLPVASSKSTSSPKVHSHASSQEGGVLGQGITQMLSNNELSPQESAIDRFMHILSVLYQDSPSAFAQADEIKGRKRIYFADDEAALLASGNTTKPKAIAGSPYWVITNTNTGRKRNIIAQLMAAMGYTHGVIERVCQSI